MERRNELYLLVLSILLGVSVLKVTEVFQFAQQVKAFLSAPQMRGLSPTVVGVYFFVAGYFVFFVLVALSVYGIVQQLVAADHRDTRDMGTLVGFSVLALAIAYLCVFAVAIYALAGQPRGSP